MNYQYPLTLRFKLIALAPQIYITDAKGREIMFVRQKIFKLKEDVRIFADSSQSSEIFSIRADRIIDFSANYHFTDSRLDTPLGSIKHKGLRSIWSATYLISDAGGKETHRMTEDNPWVKVADALLDSIPFAGLVSGYFLHPSYTVYDMYDTPVLRLTKQPAFFEGMFEIESLSDTLKPEEENRLLLAILMAVQLERSRG